MDRQTPLAAATNSTLDFIKSNAYVTAVGDVTDRQARSQNFGREDPVGLKYNDKIKLYIYSV